MNDQSPSAKGGRQLPDDVAEALLDWINDGARPIPVHMFRTPFSFLMQLDPYLLRVQKVIRGKGWTGWVLHQPTGKTFEVQHPMPYAYGVVKRLMAQIRITIGIAWPKYTKDEIQELVDSIGPFSKRDVEAHYQRVRAALAEMVQTLDEGKFEMSDADRRRLYFIFTPPPGGTVSERGKLVQLFGQPVVEDDRMPYGLIFYTNAAGREAMFDFHTPKVEYIDPEEG